MGWFYFIEEGFCGFYMLADQEYDFFFRDGTSYQNHHSCIHSYCATATAGSGGHIQRILTHSS